MSILTRLNFRKISLFPRTGNIDIYSIFFPISCSFNKAFDNNWFVQKNGNLEKKGLISHTAYACIKILKQVFFHAMNFSFLF